MPDPPAADILERGAKGVDAFVENARRARRLRQRAHGKPACMGGAGKAEIRLWIMNMGVGNDGNRWKIRTAHRSRNGF